jgi:hypothetical protein
MSPTDTAAAAYQTALAAYNAALAAATSAQAYALSLSEILSVQTTANAALESYMMDHPDLTAQEQIDWITTNYPTYNASISLGDYNTAQAEADRLKNLVPQQPPTVPK